MKDKKQFIAIVIILFVLWTLRWTILLKYIPTSNYLLEAIIKIIVWIVLPVLYLSIYNKVNPWKYLKLVPASKKVIFWDIIISLLWFAIQLILNIKGNGNHLYWNRNISDWINTFLIVGITEEIMFRGFILGKLREWTSFGKANIIQAILFVLIHVPVWISLNKEYFVVDSIWEYLWAIGAIFFFGLVMGYLVKKTNSIWPAILIHSFGDLAYVLTII